MDVDSQLDPGIAEALLAFPLDLGSLSVATLPGARDMRAIPVLELSDAVERYDQLVPGKAGDPEVSIRVYRPTASSAPRPCVYWMHGGGYVLGTNQMDDARFERWCQDFGCVGVSVEYRLAPETPYPGPLDDCYAGLQWVHGHAADLGVDPGRIGIGGVSAGGGLAAALGLLARDRGEVPLGFQVLIYPMLDDRGVTESCQWEVPVWPPAANRFGWSSYLGDLAGGDVPIYAAPARATDLSGLPPTLIVVGAIDGFLDEDVDYALRLNRASVPVELHVYPGACHGFDGFAPDTPVARRAIRDVDDWVGRALRG